MPDILLYSTLALLLGFLAGVGILSYWINRLEQERQRRRKNATTRKRSPDRQFSDERLQLNLMAMEAARQMAAAAAKSSKQGEETNSKQ